ncbi:MAG: hypothetical protein ACFE0O_06480 [Opitutales bacterium]
MTAAQRQSQQQFGVLVGFLALVIILTLAVGGISTVWLRIQIARLGAQSIKNERQLAEVERNLGSLHTRIADFHQPEALTALLRSYGSDLRPIDPRQVVTLPGYQLPDEQRLRLVAGEGPTPNRSDADTDKPRFLAYDLALLRTRSDR